MVCCRRGRGCERRNPLRPFGSLVLIRWCGPDGAADSGLLKLWSGMYGPGAADKAVQPGRPQRADPAPSRPGWRRSAFPLIRTQQRAPLSSLKLPDPMCSVKMLALSTSSPSLARSIFTNPSIVNGCHFTSSSPSCSLVTLYSFCASACLQ